jgi:chromosome partitioning protein
MIICIANNKGGVGKSTTAQTLSVGLSIKGYKVLLVDADPQGNTSSTFNADKTPNNLYTLLVGQSTISNSIYKTNYIDILPSSQKLNNADKEFTRDEYILNMQYLLKSELDKVRDKYDYIIIDTPPNIGILTTNSLVASDQVIIPMKADLYSIQGLTATTQLINGIRLKTTNKDIKIMGLLITNYKAQTIVNQGLKNSIDELANSLNTKVFKSTIRDSIIFNDSQLTHSTSILKYPTHNATEDYTNFIDEVIGGNDNVK